MARIASHLSSGNSPMDATCWMPALLTGMSTAPSSAAVCSTISRTSAGFDRSAPEYATLVPQRQRAPRIKPWDAGSGLDTPTLHG